MYIQGANLLLIVLTIASHSILNQWYTYAIIPLLVSQTLYPSHNYIYLILILIPFYSMYAHYNNLIIVSISLVEVLIMPLLICYYQPQEIQLSSFTNFYQPLLFVPYNHAPFLQILQLKSLLPGMYIDKLITVGMLILTLRINYQLGMVYQVLGMFVVIYIYRCYKAGYSQQQQSKRDYIQSYFQFLYPLVLAIYLLNPSQSFNTILLKCFISCLVSFSIQDYIASKAILLVTLCVMLLSGEQVYYVCVGVIYGIRVRQFKEQEQSFFKHQYSLLAIRLLKLICYYIFICSSLSYALDHPSYINLLLLTITLLNFIISNKYLYSSLLLLYFGIILFHIQQSTDLEQFKGFGIGILGLLGMGKLSINHLITNISLSKIHKELLLLLFIPVLLQQNTPLLFVLILYFCFQNPKPNLIYYFLWVFLILIGCLYAERYWQGLGVREIINLGVLSILVKKMGMLSKQQSHKPQQIPLIQINSSSQYQSLFINIPRSTLPFTIFQMLTNLFPLFYVLVILYCFIVTPTMTVLAYLAVVVGILWWRRWQKMGNIRRWLKQSYKQKWGSGLKLGLSMYCVLISAICNLYKSEYLPQPNVFPIILYLNLLWKILQNLYSKYQYHPQLTQSKLNPNKQQQFIDLIHLIIQLLESSTLFLPLIMFTYILPSYLSLLIFFPNALPVILFLYINPLFGYTITQQNSYKFIIAYVGYMGITSCINYGMVWGSNQVRYGNYGQMIRIKRVVNQSGLIFIFLFLFFLLSFPQSIALFALLLFLLFSIFYLQFIDSSKQDNSAIQNINLMSMKRIKYFRRMVAILGIGGLGIYILQGLDIIQGRAMPTSFGGVIAILNLLANIAYSSIYQSILKQAAIRSHQKSSAIALLTCYQLNDSKIGKLIDNYKLTNKIMTNLEVLTNEDQEHEQMLRQLYKYDNSFDNTSFCKIYKDKNLKYALPQHSLYLIGNAQKLIHQQILINTKSKLTFQQSLQQNLFLSLDESIFLDQQQLITRIRKKNIKVLYWLKREDIEKIGNDFQLMGCTVEFIKRYYKEMIDFIKEHSQIQDLCQVMQYLQAQPFFQQYKHKINTSPLSSQQYYLPHIQPNKLLLIPIHNWEILCYVLITIYQLFNYAFVAISLAGVGVLYGMCLQGKATSGLWKIGFISIALLILIKYFLNLKLYDFNKQIVSLLISETQTYYFQVILLISVLIQIKLLKNLGMFSRNLSEIQSVFIAFIRKIVNYGQTKTHPQLLPCIRAISVKENYSFFYRVFSKFKLKPGHNLYPAILLNQILIAFFIFFFFDLIDIDDYQMSSINEVISFNNFSSKMLIGLFLHVVVMIVDWGISNLYVKKTCQQWVVRYFIEHYLGKVKGGMQIQKQVLLQNTYEISLIIKYIQQVFLFVFINYYVFIAIPNHNHKLITYTQPANGFSNIYLRIFYLLYSIYFFLNSLQIKLGFTPFKGRNYLLKQPSFGGYLLFKTFTAIPFLYQFKKIFEWTLIPTALTLFHWLKLEDLHAKLFLAKCNANFLIHKPFGKKLPWYYKILGIFGILAIFIMVIGPMVLYSKISPFHAQNPITQIHLYLKLQTPHSTYTIFQVSHTSSISHLNQKQLIAHRFNQHPYKQIDKDTFYRVQLMGYPQKNWKVVKMSVDQGFMIVQLQVKRKVTGKTTSVQVSRVQLSSYEIKRIRDSLQNGNRQPIELCNLFTKVIRIDMQNKFHFLQSHLLKKQSYLSFNTQGNKKYWKLTKTTNPNQGVTLFIISDKQSSAFFNYSVTSFYITFVFMIGRLLRYYMQKSVSINDAPQPDVLLKICEAVTDARVQQDLYKQQMVYFEIMDLVRCPQVLKMISGEYVKFRQQRMELEQEQMALQDKKDK